MRKILFFSLAAVLITIVYIGNESLNIRDRVTIIPTEDSEVPEDMRRARLKAQERIEKIQMALTKAGFYKGELDGKFRPQTLQAIIAFQRTKGLDSNGIVDAKTWDQLKGYLEQ